LPSTRNGGGCSPDVCETDTFPPTGSPGFVRWRPVQSAVGLVRQCLYRPPCAILSFAATSGSVAQPVTEFPHTKDFSRQSIACVTQSARCWCSTPQRLRRWRHRLIWSTVSIPPTSTLGLPMPTLRPPAPVPRARFASSTVHRGLHRRQRKKRAQERTPCGATRCPVPGWASLPSRPDSLLTRDWSQRRRGPWPIASPVLSADYRLCTSTAATNTCWALNSANCKPKWSVPLNYLAQTPPSFSGLRPGRGCLPDLSTSFRFPRSGRPSGDVS